MTPMGMGIWCPPAEDPLVLSGWAWLASLSWPRLFLVLLGYLTAGAVTFWPVLNTFIGAFQMQAVGRGTRGEPFVLSLLSYTCSLYLSLMSNDWRPNDSVWINGLGAFFYLVYLLLFLYLADDDHRRTTLSTWVTSAAVVYLGLVTGVGVATESTDAIQWMCTLVALAATCVPLALAFFVMERYVENLPDWLSSSVSLLYSVVWLVLGIVPNPDFHAVGQNAVGIICSLIFLYLLKKWPSNPAVGGALDNPAPHQHVIHVPAAGGAPDDPLLEQQFLEVPQGPNQQLAGVPQGANLPLVDNVPAAVPQVANQQLAAVPQGANLPLVANLSGAVPEGVDQQPAAVPEVAIPPLVANLPGAVLQGDNQEQAAVPEVAIPPLVANLPGTVLQGNNQEQAAVPQGVNPPLDANLPVAVLQGDNQQLAAVPQVAILPLIANLPDAVVQEANQQLAGVPQPGLVDPAVLDV